MDDEEKKSLPRPEPHPFQNGLGGFGLHCFPDIPVDEPANVQRCLSTEEKFQRINYDNMESNRTP